MGNIQSLNKYNIDDIFRANNSKSSNSAINNDLESSNSAINNDLESSNSAINNDLESLNYSESSNSISEINSVSLDSIRDSEYESESESSNLLSETESEFDIKTWNGAKSYGNLNNPLVELFFKSVRDISCTDYRCINVKQSKQSKKIKINKLKDEKCLEEYFIDSWNYDRLRTLKFIFYLRDCRNGKGERKLFRSLVNYMIENGLSNHIVENMEYIPYFGSWKDISICFFGTPLEYYAINMIVNQLKNDKDSEYPSLCGKYSPSEGGAIDKEHKAATKIANGLNVSLTNYRKKYLTPLRSKLNIVETKMCSDKWENIEYEKVPSIALLRYKNAFNRNDNDRYKQYINNVKLGNKKINTKVLMPYQIISPYLMDIMEDDIMEDDLAEVQWSSFINDRKKKFLNNINFLPLIDVSGSMFNSNEPRPINVAISMGILFSMLNTSEQYGGKFITFSESPELLSIEGDTLKDQVNMIRKTKWGGNTNFQAAFDLILDEAVKSNVYDDEIPETLLILSDMQFDQADRSTNWEEIERKYNEAGLKRPRIIFWNLTGKSKDYPVPNDKVMNCILLSGFSDNVMYSLMEGKLTNPSMIVNNILDDEKYNMIHLA